MHAFTQALRAAKDLPEIVQAKKATQDTVLEYRTLVQAEVRVQTPRTL